MRPRAAPAAGRLRARQPSSGLPPQGTYEDGGGDRAQGRRGDGNRRTPQRGDDNARLPLGGGHGKPYDGGGTRGGHNLHRKRRERARDREPRGDSAPHGGSRKGRRHGDHPCHGHGFAPFCERRDHSRPHRGRHLPHGRRDHQWQRHREGHLGELHGGDTQQAAGGRRRDRRLRQRDYGEMGRPP